ncbi:porin [Acidiphilium sp. AL]|uniref:Porin n=1 Tax=Acidiphilium iwatense TaxID=768198 RepID=A0ABS9E100_9PROT|nr:MULTISPECIES: outer membrane beta-barrel protein [Acidiphilium]MCF3947710.1 porin [Acidiphilium iwatense]MCU4160066.1 porin [Acidiphilium sp. AL]
MQATKSTKRERLKRSRLIALGFGSALSMLALQSAQAFNGPANIKIDGGPLGPLELSGGADGYFYGLSGTGNSANPGLLGTDKATGAEFLNGLIQVQKTTGLVQFTVEVGSTTSFVLGAAPTRTSVQTFSTGPLYAGYVTLAPNTNFSISAGQIASLEGYESGIDWNNANLLTTDLFSVENSQSRGVTATYTQGPVSGTLTFGDGWDTGVWNFLQGLVTYTFNSNNSLSVYGATNLGRTGLNANIYGSANLPYDKSTVANFGPYFVNSTMIGAYYSYTLGNLNLVPEVQYVYAKVDHKLGLDKYSSNLGAALFADYQFGKSPYSIGAWAEYFSSNGPDNWFINPGAQGIGVSISPTWQHKYLFVRGDVGLLHLTKFSNNGSRGYGNDGGSRNQADFLLEGGILF